MMKHVLSLGQRWRIKVAGSDTNINSITTAYRIISKSSIDIRKLEVAVDELSKLVPILTVAVVNDKLIYGVHQPQLKIFDRVESISQFQHELQNQPMIISLDPLFNIYLVTDKTTQKYLVIHTNHLLVDTLSYAILFSKLSLLYNNLNNKLQLDNLFAEYTNAEMQRSISLEYLQSLENLYKYTKKHNVTLSSNIRIASSMCFTIPSEIVNKLQKIAQKEALSLFSVYYAWFAVHVNKVLFKSQRMFGLIFCHRLVNKKYMEAVGPFCDPEVILGLDNITNITEASLLIHNYIINGISGKIIHLINLYEKYNINFNILFDYQELDTNNPLYIGNVKLRELSMISSIKIRRDLSVKLIKSNNSFKLNLRYDKYAINSHLLTKMVADMTKIENCYV